MQSGAWAEHAFERAADHSIVTLAKHDLIGTFAHRAIVVASDPGSRVSIRSARRTTVRFEIRETFLLAWSVPDGRLALAFRVDAHDDEHLGLSWVERARLRVDASAQYVTNEAFVPLGPGAEPVPRRFAISAAPERTPGGLVWAPVAEYWVRAGIVRVRHDLARVE